MSGGWFETLHLQTRCGTESLFSPVPGPGTVDSQGQIEFLRCYATLKTKSQTKFYLEFHSSCLESTCLLKCLLGGQARLFHKSLVIDGAFLRSLGKTTDQPQSGGGWGGWGHRVGLQVDGTRRHPVTTGAPSIPRYCCSSPRDASVTGAQIPRPLVDSWAAGPSPCPSGQSLAHSRVLQAGAPTQPEGLAQRSRACGGQRWGQSGAGNRLFLPGVLCSLLHHRHLSQVV